MPQRRDELLDKFLDQQVDKELFDRAMERYDGEIKTLTEAIAKQQNIDATSMAIVSNIFELALRARNLYLNIFNEEEKRRFLNLATSNFLLKNNLLDIPFKNGFDALQKHPITAENESGAREGT